MARHRYLDHDAAAWLFYGVATLACPHFLLIAMVLVGAI